MITYPVPRPPSAQAELVLKAPRLSEWVKSKRPMSSHMFYTPNVLHAYLERLAKEVR